MIGAVVRESSYRFRATLRRRWTGYLTLVVLIGLVGGVALAAVAGARRTQSSFPAYLASTHPSDLGMFTEFGPITGIGYSAKVDEAVARVPYVKQAVAVIGFDGTLQVLGHHHGTGVAGEAPPALEGSTGSGAAYFSTDRVTVLQGRMADPARPDEIVMSSGAAAHYGLHLGSILRVAFFTDAQASQPDFSGYPGDKPHLIVPFKLVGIVEWTTQVVQDDDAALGNQIAVITPALTRQLETCCAYYSYVSFHLEGGLAHEGAVVSAVDKVIPNLGPVGGSTTNAPYVAKAERAIRPEAIALGVFGLIAALAALVISGQVISRLIRRNETDGAILRALGAGPAMAMADGLAGVLGAIVAGSLLAVGVAAALSPLTPIGPVRPVYPDIGVAFDWTVLGFGFLLFMVVLTGAALFVAYRVAPHRSASHVLPDHDAVWNQAAASAGLPPSAVLGIRAALGSRAGRDAAPVRSALLGAVLAVVVIVTSLTFASSLNAAGVAAAPLRMELGLRPVGRLLRRREPAGRRDDHSARTRSRRGPLDRRLLRECQAGRAVRAGAGHEAGRHRQPLHALGPGVGVAVTGRARAGDPGRAARPPGRHRRRPGRWRDAGPARRRDGHAADNRRIGRSQRWRWGQGR